VYFCHVPSSDPDGAREIDGSGALVSDEYDGACNYCSSIAAPPVTSRNQPGPDAGERNVRVSRRRQSAAGSLESEAHTDSQPTSEAVMANISDDAYNKARTILANAGSDSAKKSHVKHTGGKGSPEDHGKQLLREARDEFRKKDKGQPNLKSEMTVDHYNAIHKAAQEMKISSW
jgi:hypothetical protein